MSFVNYLGYLLPEEMYTIVTTIYLVSLNMLNKKLLLIKFDNEFALLAYESYLPAKFFLGALLLFTIGICLIVYRIRKYKHYELSFEEVMASFLAVLVIVILLVLLFKFIDNPILRAVITCVASILGIGIGMAKTV